ncbi:MAG TPA: substrate-binding domain-containing protein [Anaerolineae bacterium]|nr:substrate-binding domain-containing protein [Anaerolineae bacterium]
MTGLRAGDYAPPWSSPPQGGVRFTVPCVDNAPDLHGTPYRPDLVILFGGNQFMVLPPLMEAFRQAYPVYPRIYYETLPPGIVERQLRTGSLVMGNLCIDVPADVFVAGSERVKRLHDDGLVEAPRAYLSNRLAIMVYRDNPKGIRGLADLDRDDVRVAMPNLETEGIAEKAVDALKKAGGQALSGAVMEAKVADGTTFITQIHHRETPLRVLHGESDAGVVWITEALFQQRLGHPVDYVEIPEAHNAVGKTAVAIVRGAVHAQAVADFATFLVGSEAAEIYAEYGFEPVDGHSAQ